MRFAGGRPDGRLNNAEQPNGRQMADAARVSPWLKTLFITGFAENALLKDAQLEAGMAVLTKPFPLTILSVRMRDLIASTL